MAKINYNGMELEEVTEPQIFVPPREMFVWDFESCSSNAISKKKVLAIFPNKKEYRRNEIKPVLATDGTKWNFCANVPAPRRATNRELAKWLAQGKGEWGISKFGVIEKAEIGWFYDTGYEKQTLQSEMRVRKWDDNEWHMPDVEYMSIEEDK